MTIDANILNAMGFDFTTLASLGFDDETTVAVFGESAVSELLQSVSSESTESDSPFADAGALLVNGLFYLGALTDPADDFDLF